MKKEKREKIVIIRKSDIVQIVAYSEVRVQKTTFFGNKFDEIIEKPKIVIFCNSYMTRPYTIRFEDTFSMNEWLDNFKKELDNQESGSFIQIKTMDL
jgi:hypothetical protein